MDNEYNLLILYDDLMHMIISFLSWPEYSVLLLSCKDISRQVLSHCRVQELKEVYKRDNHLLTIMESCVRGYLWICVCYSNLNPKYIESHSEILFNLACKYNNSDLAIWIYMISITKINSFLGKDHHISIPISYLRSGMPDIHFGSEYPFRSAAKNGDLDFCQWLLDMSIREYIFSKNHSTNSGYMLDINAADSDAFISACKNGHLNLISWLLDMGVYVHTQNDLAFRSACMGGHIDIVDILLQLFFESNYVKHYTFFNKLFHRACNNGNYLIAEKLLLYDKYSVIIPNENDNITFAKACINNHFNVAKFLFEVIVAKYPEDESKLLDMMNCIHKKKLK